MAGHIIECLKLEGTCKDHMFNNQISIQAQTQDTSQQLVGKDNAPLSPKQDNAGRNIQILAYLSIKAENLVLNGRT